MYSTAQTELGDWIITHPRHPGLVWSEAGWTFHTAFAPERRLPAIHFATEQDADDFATENYLYPRVD